MRDRRGGGHGGGQRCAVTALIVVLITAALTFLLRSSLVVAFGERAVPARVRRAGSYVLPAMMSALAASALVPARGGTPDAGLVVVALVGGTASVRFRSIAWPFLTGLAAYGLLSLTPL
jgi:branched-subunit amino acid transport protein